MNICQIYHRRMEQHDAPQFLFELKIESIYVHIVVNSVADQDPGWVKNQDPDHG